MKIYISEKHLFRGFSVYKLPVYLVFFTMFCRSEIGDLYPNKFVNLDEKRIYVLNTLFHLPGMSFDTVNFLNIMQEQKIMARF